MARRTVSDAPLGSAFTVDTVATDERALRRLAELGVRPGSRVTVLRRTAGGGRIVGVAGARVALDAGTAGTIRLLDGLA